jgi:hypothetical protein
MILAIFFIFRMQVKYHLCELSDLFTHFMMGVLTGSTIFTIWCHFLFILLFERPS